MYKIKQINPDGSIEILNNRFNNIEHAKEFAAGLLKEAVNFLSKEGINYELGTYEIITPSPDKLPIFEILQCSKKVKVTKVK